MRLGVLLTRAILFCHQMRRRTGWLLMSRCNTKANSVKNSLLSTKSNNLSGKNVSGGSSSSKNISNTAMCSNSATSKVDSRWSRSSTKNVDTSVHKSDSVLSATVHASFCKGGKTRNTSPHLSTLTHVQDTLKRNKEVPAKVALQYMQYLHIPPVKNSNASQLIKRHYNFTQKQLIADTTVGKGGIIGGTTTPVVALSSSLYDNYDDTFGEGVNNGISYSSEIRNSKHVSAAYYKNVIAAGGRQRQMSIFLAGFCARTNTLDLYSVDGNAIALRINVAELRNEQTNHKVQTLHSSDNNTSRSNYEKDCNIDDIEEEEFQEEGLEEEKGEYEENEYTDIELEDEDVEEEEYAEEQEEEGSNSCNNDYDRSNNKSKKEQKCNNVDADYDWFTDIADDVMAYTSGAVTIIIIPIVTTEVQRHVMKPHVTNLSNKLASSGLLSVSEVDTLELASAFCGANGSASLENALMDTTNDALAKPFSVDWYHCYWNALRVLACKSAEEDPLFTISTYILPQFEILVVHLVVAGAHTFSISIWDPIRRRRFTSKGMLSDVLACLFNTHSQKMIIVPTNRTDRATLFRCRTALLKTGKQCVIVFASQIDIRHRQTYHSDPFRYWCAIKEVDHAADADLFFKIRRAAGNTLRMYHTKATHNSAAHSAEIIEQSIATNKTAIATPSEVMEWLKIFTLPARLASEEKELVYYEKYLIIAYTATDYTAHGQPHNPTSPLNYVLCTCMMDFKKHKLEPWVKYNARGEFTLPSLIDYNVLVIHDAKKFMLLLDHDSELHLFLRRGGRVWCTMLAEYLLDAQRIRSGANDIRDVALRHGQVLPPNSMVGHTNNQLPLSFHRFFLLEAIVATAKVFKAQLERSYAQCQVCQLAHRMDALLAMTAMESAGIAINLEEAERQSKALANAANLLEHALLTYVPKQIPIDLRREFDWNSSQHLHAYLFGGSLMLGHLSQLNQYHHHHNNNSNNNDNNKRVIGKHKEVENAEWVSNLVHLLHKYGQLDLLNSELHLQLFAAQCRVSTKGKLAYRVTKYIEDHGTQNLKKYRIVIMDIESTGLNTSSDEMIEIAMYDPEENSTFCSLINPQRPISPRTIPIHHITDREVRNAPTLDVVMKKGVVPFLRLDKDSRDSNEIILLVGHNVFSLDEPMLRRAFEMHAPHTDYKSILFCDSINLLRALRYELRSDLLLHRRIDVYLFDTLSSSLRLKDLITNLRIVPEGDLHRAETDTKALWSVLVTAYGVANRPVSLQRERLLKGAAHSFVEFPGLGCFKPNQQRVGAIQISLPGVACELTGNAKLIDKLQRKPLTDQILQVLYSNGVKVAGLLLQRRRLDQHTSRFLNCEDENHNLGSTTANTTSYKNTFSTSVGIDGGGGGNNNNTGSHLAALHNDGVIRQHIDMTATTTSRTTSAYPSCQNIPKDDKSIIRRLFISRFGEQGRCVEIDYSQLEIVVLANLCKDANLVRDLRSGVDFHIKRAAFFSGLSYEEIAEGCRCNIPKYVQLRKKAKQFSFQRLYGAGTRLLHKTTGISIEDLEESIRKENEEYPGIARFHRLMRAVALRANNPGLPTNFIIELPTGVRMSYRTRDVIFNLPPLKNYPIQGYGAELAQMMLGRLFRRFASTNYYNQRAFITNFVHDSVWLDCHVSVTEHCVRDACQIMSEVHTYLPKAFPGASLVVPMHVTASCGVDMYSMQPLHLSNLSVIRIQQKVKPNPHDEQLKLLPSEHDIVIGDDYFVSDNDDIVDNTNTNNNATSEEKEKERWGDVLYHEYEEDERRGLQSVHGNSANYEDQWYEEHQEHEEEQEEKEESDIDEEQDNDVSTVNNKSIDDKNGYDRKYETRRTYVKENKKHANGMQLELKDKSRQKQTTFLDSKKTRSKKSRKTYKGDAENYTKDAQNDIVATVSNVTDTTRKRKGKSTI